jgi:hypothetical protein
LALREREREADTFPLALMPSPPSTEFAAAENKAMDDTLLQAIHDIARTGNVR